MIKGIKLEKFKDISIKGSISEYKKPKFVYIPLRNKNDKKYECQLKKGQYVYKGSVVAVEKDTEFPIHASVSGYAIDVERHLYLDGEKVICIVIENDFKEKYETRIGAKKLINNYTKRQFIELLKDCGVTGMGGADFPTYLKYKTKEKINTLIINGVECEPYITSDYMIMKNYPEEILEAIDAILDINNIEKAIIAIKYTDDKLFKEFNKYLGTYPNIKLCSIDDMYPLGWERQLVEVVTKNKYNKLPLEKGIIINNVSTIYAIYQVLKYNRPITERIVTFSGNCFKQNQNILVKIGTMVRDVIEEFGYKKGNDIRLIAGGPMMGISVSNDDLIISKDLNCVIALKDSLMTSLVCINCGRCNDACPAGILPVLIKNYIHDDDMLEKLQPKKCCECGLCSYVCPAKIELREFVKTAKEKVGE